jgi:hypothetical protein
LLEASAKRRYELTLARKDAMSFVSMVKITSEFFREISALPSAFGRRLRSGASASRIEVAARLDFTDTLILALQLFKVNIVCPCSNLEFALWAAPYAGCHPAEPERAA